MLLNWFFKSYFMVGSHHEMNVRAGLYEER